MTDDRVEPVRGFLQAFLALNTGQWDAQEGVSLLFTRISSVDKLHNAYLGYIQSRDAPQN